MSEKIYLNTNNPAMPFRKGAEIETCEGCGDTDSHYPVAATWAAYCCPCYGCEGREHCQKGDA